MALLRRELLAHLRLKRVFFMAAAVVASMAIMYSLSWPEDLDQERSGATLFNTTLMMAFGVCLLFVPGLACASVTAERQNDSLDMLRMTVLKPRHIVFSKVVNAVTIFLLIAFAVLPMVSSLYFLTGLDARSIAIGCNYLLVAVLLCGLSGVAAGAWIRNPVAALVGAYLLSVHLVAPTAAMIFNTVTSIWDALTGVYYGIEFTRVRTLSPMYGAFDTNSSFDGFLSMVPAYYFLIACFLWWLAARGLRRSAGVRRAVKPIRNPVELRARRRRFPFYLSDPRSAVAPIEDWENPFLVRETRWGWVGRAAVMWRQFYLSLICFGAMAYFTVLVNFDLSEGGLLYFLQMAIPLFAAVLYTSNVMTQDRDAENFDALRMTPRPPAGIFRGKIYSVLFRLMPILASILVTQMLVVIALYFKGNVGISAFVLACAVVPLNNLLLTIALCALISVLTRNSAMALVTSMLLVIFVQLAPIVPGVLFRERFTPLPIYLQCDISDSRVYSWEIGGLVLTPAQTNALLDMSEYAFAPGANYLYMLTSEPFETERLLLWGSVNLFYFLLACGLLACARWQFTRRFLREG